ncbi:MAG: precorrin-2 C(20)-methyltransferase [Deferrisomatales bacterium]
MVERALPGHFYAVGVGPGAPDLLTLRAARLVATADVVIAPRSEKSDDSLALQVVRPHLRAPGEGQEVVEHPYPMARDLDRTLQCWGEVADRVARDCGAGRSVVQITIGDPSIYSTSSYLLGLLEGRLAEGRVHVVPGISAFQAAAARFADPLTLQEDRLLLMPATDLAEVEKALAGDCCETLVLYKAGRSVADLRDLLRRRGLADRARAVFYVEQERETAVRNLDALDDAAAEAAGYMATVIVHLGRRNWAG